jgi:hypothetical protein
LLSPPPPPLPSLPCEDTMRTWPSANQVGPHQKPDLASTLILDSQLLELEEIKFFWLSHLVYNILLQQTQHYSAIKWITTDTHKNMMNLTLC